VIVWASFPSGFVYFLLNLIAQALPLSMGQTSTILCLISTPCCFFSSPFILSKSSLSTLNFLTGRRGCLSSSSLSSGCSDGPSSLKRPPFGARSISSLLSYSSTSMFCTACLLDDPPIPPTLIRWNLNTPARCKFLPSELRRSALKI
jgi:hypothetical protein